MSQGQRDQPWARSLSPQRLALALETGSARACWLLREDKSWSERSCRSQLGHYRGGALLLSAQAGPEETTSGRLSPRSPLGFTV